MTSDDSGSGSASILLDRFQRLRETPSPTGETPHPVRAITLSRLSLEFAGTKQKRGEAVKLRLCELFPTGPLSASQRTNGFRRRRRHALHEDGLR